MKNETDAVRSVAVSWSDPRTLAEASRSMPGIEFLRAIRDGRLPPPPIAQLMGFSLVDAFPANSTTILSA
jgi:hypothetical protein